MSDRSDIAQFSIRNVFRIPDIAPHAQELAPPEFLRESNVLFDGDGSISRVIYREWYAWLIAEQSSNEGAGSYRAPLMLSVSRPEHRTSGVPTSNLWMFVLQELDAAKPLPSAMDDARPLAIGDSLHVTIALDSPEQAKALGGLIIAAIIANVLPASITARRINDQSTFELFFEWVSISISGTLTLEPDKMPEPRTPFQECDNSWPQGSRDAAEWPIITFIREHLNISRGALIPDRGTNS